MDNRRRKRVAAASGKRNKSSEEKANNTKASTATFVSKIQALFMHASSNDISMCIEAINSFTKDEINKPISGDQNQLYNTVLMKTCEYICAKQTISDESSSSNRGKGNSFDLVSHKGKDRDGVSFEDIIIALLRAGADPNLTDSHMNSAVSIAFSFNCKSIALLLLQNEYSPVNSSTNPVLAIQLLNSAFLDDPNKLRLSSGENLVEYLTILLDHDVGWCYFDSSMVGNSASTCVSKKKIKKTGLIQAACRYGVYSVVEMLLRYTAKPAVETQSSSSNDNSSSTLSTVPFRFPSTLGLEMAHYVDDAGRTALEIVEAAYLANHLELLQSYPVDKAKISETKSELYDMFVSQENVSTLLKYVNVETLGCGGDEDLHNSDRNSVSDDSKCSTDDCVSDESVGGESNEGSVCNAENLSCDLCSDSGSESESETDSNSESSDGYGSYEDDDSQYVSDTDSDSESDCSMFSPDRQSDKVHSQIIIKLAQAKKGAIDGVTATDANFEFDEAEKLLVEKRQLLFHKQAELLKILVLLVECIGVREVFSGLTYPNLSANEAAIAGNHISRELKQEVKNTNRLHTALVKVVVLVGLGGIGAVLNKYFSKDFELYTDHYKCCVAELQLKSKYFCRPGSLAAMGESLDFSDPAFDNQVSVDAGTASGLSAVSDCKVGWSTDNQDQSSNMRSCSGVTSGAGTDDFYNDDIVDELNTWTEGKDQETYYMLPAIYLMRGVSEFYHSLQLCCLLTHNLPRSTEPSGSAASELADHGGDHCGYYYMLLELWNNLWGLNRTVASMRCYVAMGWETPHSRHKSGHFVTTPTGVSDDCNGQTLVSMGLDAIAQLPVTSGSGSANKVFPDVFEIFNERSVHFLFYILCALHPTLSPEDVHTWSVIISELVLGSKTSTLLAVSASRRPSLDVGSTCDASTNSTLPWSYVLSSPAIAAFILNAMVNAGRIILFGTPQQIYQDSTLYLRNDPLINDQLLFQSLQELFLRIVVPRLPAVYDNCRALEAPTLEGCCASGVGKNCIPKLSKITPKNSLLKAITGYICPGMLGLWESVDHLLSNAVQPLEESCLARVVCMFQSLYVWALVDGNTYHPQYTQGPCIVKSQATKRAKNGKSSQSNSKHTQRSQGNKTTEMCLPPTQLVYTDPAGIDMFESLEGTRWTLNKTMCDTSIVIESNVTSQQAEYAAGIEVVCNSPVLEAGRYLGYVAFPEQPIHLDVDMDLTYTSLCPDSMVVGWDVFSHAQLLTSMNAQQSLRSLSISMEGFNTVYSKAEASVGTDSLDDADVAPPHFRQVKYPSYVFELIDQLTFNPIEVAVGGSPPPSSSVILSGGGCVRVSSADNRESHDESILGSFGSTSNERLLQQYPYTFTNCVTGSYVGTFLLRHRGLVVPPWFWDLVINRQTTLDCIYESDRENNCGLYLGFLRHMRAFDPRTLPPVPRSVPEHTLKLTVYDTYRWDSLEGEGALVFATEQLRTKGEFLEESRRCGFMVARGYHFDMLKTYTAAETNERSRRKRSNTFRVKTNRFETPDVWVDSIIQQFMVPDPYLATRDFDVSYKREAGTGPGPMREFFEMCASVLFGVGNVNSAATSAVCVTAAEKRVDELAAGVEALRINSASSAPSSDKKVGSLSYKNKHRRARIKKGNRGKQEVCYCDIFPVFQPGSSTHSHFIVPRSIPDIQEDFWYRTGFNRHDSKLKSELDQKIRNIFEVCGMVIGLASMQTEPLGVNLPVILWDHLVFGVDERCKESNETLQQIHQCVTHKAKAGRLLLKSLSNNNSNSLTDKAAASTQAVDNVQSRCRYAELSVDLDECVQEFIRTCGGSDTVLKRSCDQILRMSSAEIDALGLSFEGVRFKWTCNHENVAASTRNDTTAHNSGSVSSKNLQYRLVSVSVPLCKNRKKMVNNMNKFEYIYLKLRMYCVGDTHNVWKCMRNGLVRIIPQHLLCLMTPSYLQTLLCGDRTSFVDVHLLQKHVIYEAPYNATHPVVLMFWKVLRQYFNNTPWINADGPSNSNSCEPQTPNPSRDVNEARLRKLILFWTGSSSLPSRGYYANSHDHATANSEEQEPMVIGEMVPAARKKGVGTNDVNKPCHLPTASTCDKTLRIPKYETAEDMLVGLNAAIEYGCIGFDKA